MARNEEKARTQLNRLHASKQEKLHEDKYHIPPLATLETAQQVKRYIPRIRREISYCLRQISKKRFRDYKIEEFKERLDKLKNQYRSFNKKAIKLDPNMVALPGKKHAYVPKRKVEEMKQRRKLALEQNPNGFRQLYGTTSLEAAKPIEWEEIEETEAKEEGEGEDREMEEGDGEEEAVDQFLEDAGDSEDEAESARKKEKEEREQDPDFIATPLMQQYKVEQQKIANKERAVSATGLTSLMGYGSSDSE
eukprot:Phypoly_transcript_05857.p2 GENE.Phypoly_transcript_05857~~Phypoly_transcript_05857.p2  ORF type:complete len:250 (-),score=57.99 Phypoly_transcript_05857:91-840(-)